jgi:hypothetical protein
MIIFLHIEKTAGTSFKTLLRANYGIGYVEANKIKRSVFTDQDLRFAKKIFFRIDVIAGHNLKDPQHHLHIAGGNLITFLRQPVDRFISHYQDRVIRNGLQLTFEEWANRKENQNLMVRSIAGSEDLQRAKEILKDQFLFVGLTEYFEESLTMLNSFLEKPLALSYRTSVKSRSDQVRDQIKKDEKSMELARKCNKLDQLLYDYTLSHIFLPRLGQLPQKVKDARVVADQFTWKQRIFYAASVKYNNFIYRPLIKILHK